MVDSNGTDKDSNLRYDATALKNEQSSSVIATGSVQLMDDSEYSFDKELGYIEFQMTLQNAARIGVRIHYLDKDGVERVSPAVVGQTTDPQDSTIIVVKMIKEANVSDTDPTWPLEWRHAYYLGARDLSPDDFSLNIVDGKDASEPDTPADISDTYMQVMGLDETGSGLVGEPDGLVDFNRAKVDLARGMLFFPYLEPFKEAFEDAGLAPNEGTPLIYTESDRTQVRNSRRYVIIAKYSRAATRINLGFNILEDTEVVKLNGSRLTKGIDYNINYYTGELTFTQTVADQVSQPGADLSIDYEVNPLFKPDQETLVGLRGLYKIGTNGQVGATFMYNNERTSAQRVRVGEEPTLMTIAGMDAAYEFEPNWLTRAVDALPFIESDATSQVRFEGEVARSMPNLNNARRGLHRRFRGREQQESDGRLPSVVAAHIAARVVFGIVGYQVKTRPGGTAGISRGSTLTTAWKHSRSGRVVTLRR